MKVPKLTELLEALESDQDNVGSDAGEDLFESRYEDIKSEAEWTHLKGLSDHYRHKNYWSFFLMFLLGFMAIAQYWLLYKVGIQHWDFTQYDWLLPVLLVQNLAQIVGLAAFAVRALFKRLTPDLA